MSQTVARLKVDSYQYLNPDGTLVDDRQVPQVARDFDLLVELYELMSLTRVFDAKAVALQRTGQLCTYASSLGHEAAHVAIGAAMKHEDCLAPIDRKSVV